MSIDGRRSVGADRLRATVLEPEIPARPGEPARCTLRVFNDRDDPVTITVRVHGLGPGSVSLPVVGEAIAQSGATDLPLDLPVPESFGVGSHAVAVEVSSALQGDRPALAQCTLTIATLDQVVARIEPPLLRGGRRAKFRVEIENRAQAPATIGLDGSGPALTVTLAAREITMAGGGRAVVRGKVRGPRRITGDPVQHVLTVETRSNSTPRYATAAYRQRAMLPRRVRSGMLALSVLLVWVAIAVAAVVWWSGRDKPADKDAGAQVIDANGDGVPDATTADGQGADGQGSGSDGSGTGADGSGGAAGGGAGGGNSAADVPTSAIVRGTVKAGTTGQDDGVLVTLTPTLPGDAATQSTSATSATGATAAPAAPSGFVAGGFGSARHVGANPAPRGDSDSDGPTKSWPARSGNYHASVNASGLSRVRTVSVASQATSIDGSWQFSDVALHQSYEVSFSKPGFNTKAFIVAPTEDGKPVELEVELAPADGALGGTATGLGKSAAEVIVTDGTLTFHTTTSTGSSNPGAWSIAGVSTPGTYSITFTSEGFGSEVMQVVLAAGDSRTDLVLAMHAGVGSISGTVTADGDVKGGVTLTATAGDTKISTTSLTEGAKGTYTFPQLELGTAFTLTASAEGYITQTRSQTVNGNATDVDFALVRSTATIVGQVMSSRNDVVAPLVSAAVSVKADDLEVRTSSAAAPVPGSFSATDLPPGSYVVTISRYDHPAVTQLVDLVAGQVLDIGQVVLTFQAPSTLTPTGSVTVRTVDAFGQPLNGSTVQLIDIGGEVPAVSKSMPATDNAVQFTAVPIGTYRVRVTKPDYRPGTIEQLSIGLSAVERQVVLLQFGTARGSVVDVAAGYQDPSPGLLDDRGHPVYATRSGVKVYIDPDLPIEIPPVSKVGVGAVAAYNDAGGRLVVKYASGDLLLDLIGNDGIPDEPLAVVTEKVGKVKLDSYELLLYRLNGTVRVCVGVVTASGNEWKIDPEMQIVTGNYVMRFTPLAGEVGTQCTGRGIVPDGFAAIPTNADGDVASFEISANLDQRVVVDPIPVAPYPRVSGRVVIPHVVAGTVVFDGFADAVANGLTVMLDCGNGRTLVAPLTEVPAAGTPGSTSFELTRSAIAGLYAGVPYDPTTGALPTCTLSATSTGGDYIPVSVDVPLGVALAAPYADRVVNVALVDDPTVITGTVRWRDLGATGTEPPDYAVPGALVASDTDVVVAFTPSNDPDADGPTGSTVAGADPGAVTLPVSQTSDPLGQWAFAVTGQRQLLDTERYTVSAAHFAPSQLDVEATGSGWTPTAVPPARVDFTPSPGGSGLADVFLQPLPGTLTGAVQITSIRGQAAVGEVEMVPTAPDGTVGAAVAPAAGNYTIDPAAAGTWQLDFGPADPAVSNLYQASTRAFVGPEQAATAPVTHVVELGQVNVELSDQSQRPIVANDVHVRLEQVDVGTTTPAGPYDTTADPDAVTGELAFRRLPVNTANPTNVDTRYRITGQFPNYDIANAEIHYSADFNHNGVIEPGEVRVDLNYDPVAGIELPIAAGTVMSVQIIVPAFATITGAVRGVTSPPLVSPATWVGLTVDDVLTIEVTRLDAPAPPAGYVFTAVGADGFSIQVPTGRYSLTFRAPNFISQSTAEIVAETPNEVVPYLPNPVLLQMQTRTLNLTTLTKLGTAGGPDTFFNGALVQLWWGTVDPLNTTAVPLHTPTSSVDGSADVAGIYPGRYTLLATARVGGSDLNFPVIGEIVVDPAPEGTTTTVDLKLLMPEVGGSISGTATAKNRVDRPVALPTGLQVTRTYDLAQLGGPGVVPNQADESVLLPAQTPNQQNLVEASPGVGAPYSFTVLPAGEHVVAFTHLPAGGAFDPAPAGEPPGPVVVQDRNDDVVLDVAYKAHDVPVTVTVSRSTAAVGDPDYFVTDATVTLTEAPGQTGMFDPGTPTQTSSGIYDFGVVPPDLVGYVLHVSAPGYTVRTDTSEIIDPSTTTHDIAVQLVPLTTVTGTALRQDTEAGPATVVPDSTWVHLIDVATGLDVPGAQLTFEPGTGKFTFAVDGGVAYRVDVSDPARPATYKTKSAAVNGGSPAAPGTRYDVGTLTALKYATLAITVTAPPNPTTTTLSLVPAGPVVVASATGYSVTQIDPTVTYTIAVQHRDYEDAPIVNPVGATTFDPDIGVDYTPADVVMTPLPATAHVTVGPAEALVGLTMVVTVKSTGAVVPSTLDPDGTATVSGLVPGTTYTFTFTATNYQTSPVDVDAVANGNHPVDVTMTPKPASAQVAVTPSEAWTGLALVVKDPAGATVPSTISTTTGLANVTGLVPGRTYTFAVTATNYEQATALPVAIVPGTNAVPITMTPKPASAQVAVTPPGALTGLALSVTELPGGTVVWSTINTDGTVNVTGLVPGRTYRFAATATDYQKAPIDVAIVPGNNPVNIVMDAKPATATITLGGNVASASGFALSISPSTGVTGPTGTGPYTFSNLASGTAYTFRVVATGYITYVSSPFTASATTPITQTFTPVPLATLTDTVSGGTNGDIVYLCAGTGTCDANSTHLASATLAGGSTSFTFSGLDAGSYQVYAYRNGGHNDLKSFTVAANTGVISPFPLGLTIT